MMNKRHMSIQENKQVSLWSVKGYAFINIEMAQLLQPETETTDPRILRSRRMLMDALARLLSKKEFEDVSVQEIADEATLNRATFYLHYADKNALLQAMTESRFRDLIERRAITFTDCNGALRAIALGVCAILRRVQAAPLSWHGYARRLHIPSRGYVQGRACPSWDGARCGFGTARDHRGLGSFWSRTPLVSDPQSYPRRGDGRQD